MNNEPAAPNVFVIDPDRLRGFSITGQPSEFKYWNNLSLYREALSDFDYVFASIIQISLKGAIENPYPTLAVAFDNSEIDNFDKYIDFVSQISISIEEATKHQNLPINLLVLDNSDSYLKHVKKPTSWIVSIKKYKLYSDLKKPWWKFW